MEWTKLENHSGEKWELKYNGVLLGTIFKKPRNGRYALWVSAPLVVKRVKGMITESYECKTFEEAVAEFDYLLNEKVLKFADAVVGYLNEKNGLKSG